jgi:hypothetical protein
VSREVRIFQIWYDEATRAGLDPAFEPLDNSGNERPDWFEYWPIRGYLRRHELEADAYYGFLSPKFGDKTGVSGAQAKAFVAGAAPADVISFSPWPDQACLYASVFEQGENFHPGLVDVSQDFFDAIGLGVDVRDLVMDVRSTVYSNYFVATGAFWRRWGEILEHCVAHAEDPASPLYARLNAVTLYHRMGNAEPVQVQMKIFLLERIVSTLLATMDGLRVANHDPFNVPLSEPKMIPLGNDLIALDALKQAYLRTRERHYLSCFRALQRLVYPAATGHGRPLIPR